MARPLPTPRPAPATGQNRRPFKASDRRRRNIRHDPLNEDQKIAARSLRQANRESADKTAPAAVADEFRAKVFELMIANMSSTLKYAEQLRRAKSPVEFVKLSTIQAGAQFGLIIKQAAELGSIAQKLATPNVKPMTVVDWI